MEIKLMEENYLFLNVLVTYISILINEGILQIKYKMPVPEYLLAPLEFQHMRDDVSKV